ncbi:MAG: DUF4835 family protein [Marinilabiliaceae bacterium]
MKRFVITLLLAGVLFPPLRSQELRCAVQVVAPGVQGVNRNVFQSLRESIHEFMNNQQWTDHTYESSERIECTLHLSIEEVEGVDRFKGSLRVQSRRPVYNSSYKSTVLNLKDDHIDFNFAEQENLVYNESNIESNLVGILAYYAYVVLGYDYDTFSSEGGTPFFREAEEVVGQMQNARQSGWKSFEGRQNRYWLVDNMLDEDHQPLRDCYYEFHRKGLDVMADDREEGRSGIASSLEGLQAVYRRNPGSFALQVFLDAKQKELVNIFSESFEQEKAEVVNILTEVNPANSDTYEELLEN